MTHLLPPNCPDCSRTRVDELIGSAAPVLRVFECRDCGHRWTILLSTRTHYVGAYAQGQRPRLQAALCGTFIDPTLHTSSPTCEECERLLREDDADFARTVEALKAFDGSPNVFATKFPSA